MCNLDGVCDVSVECMFGLWSGCHVSVVYMWAEPMVFMGYAWHLCSCVCGIYVYIYVSVTYIGEYGGVFIIYM